MKLWPRAFWIPMAVLLTVFFVYPCVDQTVFGLRFCREMRVRYSKETHAQFKTRMALARQGMTSNEVVRLLGPPKHISATNGTDVLRYEWRGVTETHWFWAHVDGSEHSFELAFRDGVLQSIDQAEGGWFSSAIR